MSEELLQRYREKRHFDKTAEPEGASAGDSFAADEQRFVVQKHAARRLHYDFRLQADGVLVSWAVPKGPSYDPTVKRLAMHVEDHPVDYRSFEGTIPGGEYGAGTVIVWDEGTYRNLTEHRGRPLTIREGVDRGHVSVWLQGVKLRGGWSLTRTGGGQGDRESWILVKRRDELADPTLDVVSAEPGSARTGRTLEEVSADRAAARWTRSVATWRSPQLAQAVTVEDHRRRLGGDRWIYERKLDGLRCLAVRNGAEVALLSRNHLPFTERFPRIVAAFAALAADNFVIDGELVAFDDEQTSFSLLQRPKPDTRPVFCAFDLLTLLGRDTTELGLTERKSLLRQALAGAADDLTFVESLEGEPDMLLEEACGSGWEGLIAKRASSPYRSGRSPDWRKLKCSASQELVIGGWTEPRGSRTGFGALLVGYYEDGRLRYAGKVGTGFDEGLLRALHEQMTQRERATSPFSDPVKEKGAHWADPELVGNVAFSEWTTDGKLRHPRFEGLRPDKEASAVRRKSRMS